MASRVYLATSDLLFRSKLGAVVTAAGAVVTREEIEADVLAVQVEGPGALDRIRTAVGRGIPVLAFGAHVNAGALRAAREAGAVAVPNSQAEAGLAALLAGGVH